MTTLNKGGSGTIPKNITKMVLFFPWIYSTLYR